jgi:hypothetical protein
METLKSSLKEVIANVRKVVDIVGRNKVVVVDNHIYSHFLCHQRATTKIGSIGNLTRNHIPVRTFLGNLVEDNLAEDTAAVVDGLVVVEVVEIEVEACRVRPKISRDLPKKFELTARGFVGTHWKELPVDHIDRRIPVTVSQSISYHRTV